MFLCYLAAAASVFIYLQAFFPIQHRISKLEPSPSASPPNGNGTKIFSGKNEVPAAFDRAVLIIIDALRLDFVTPNLMPFTANFITTKDGSLETNGKREIQNGCFVTVKAETPTVTLPRIKALISGHVPQFIDVVLNLIGSSNNEGLEDSLVHQARVKRKNIVFYGDDTWLRLFPKQFQRSEGTTSFYVNDFTEVDRNVTRNVRKELDRTDWDIMILHYLGLDHIGHVYGPKSSLVPEKLTEMDSIIKEIWEKTNADRGQLSKSTKTLVIVTSDHGMKDGGGHGGATYPETHVPLVLLGQPCTSPVAMLQTDIVANLCVLLGLDVPRTSIGRLRSELLGHLSLTEYLNALRYNTGFLRTKSQACLPTIADRARSFHEEFVDGLQKNKSASDILGRQAVKTYEECSDILGENLVTLSVKQNWHGLVLSLMVMAAILFEISSKCPNGNSVATVATLLLLWQHFDAGSVAGLISGAIFVVWVVAKSLERIGFLLYSKFSYVIVMTLVHPLTFVSSSFVEEEHQFWYWVLGNFLLISAVKMTRDSHQLAYKSGDSCQKINVKFFADFCFETALPIVGLRFLRTLNQVGDQWAAEPDLSDFLLKPENFICMQIFHVTGLFLTFYVSLEPLANKSVGKVDSISNFLILLGIYLFRTLPDLTSPNKLSVVVAGQSLWFLIFSKVLVYISTGSGSLVNVWVLIITLLLKPHNAILIPYCSLVSRYVRRKFSGKNPTLNAVLHIWLANTLYFAQGHCNTLASIDVGSAYVGLSSYQPFLVGLQLVSHTYALPVLSHLLLLTEHVRKTDITDRFHRRNVKRFDDSVDSISQIFLVNFTYRLFVIFVVFLVTFVQRHHLFIWSVFAPKVFIETGHFCLICMEFGLATLFFAFLRMKEYIHVKVKR